MEGSDKTYESIPKQQAFAHEEYDNRRESNGASPLIKREDDNPRARTALGHQRENVFSSVQRQRTQEGNLQGTEYGEAPLSVNKNDSLKIMLRSSRGPDAGTENTYRTTSE